MWVFWGSEMSARSSSAGAALVLLLSLHGASSAGSGEKATRIEIRIVDISFPVATSHEGNDAPGERAP